MASKTKIAEILATIKAVYPYFSKDGNEIVTAKVWNLALKDIPDNMVEGAFLKCIQTCKMPPTPADVIEKINVMIDAVQPTDEELWSTYIKALKITNDLFYDFGFTLIEKNGKTQGENARHKVEQVWQELPQKIQLYLGNKSELLRVAISYTEDELKFEKTKFMKTLPTIKERERCVNFKSLLDKSVNLIANRNLG